MSRFAPTLRLDITAEYVEKQFGGFTVEEVSRKTLEYFNNLDIKSAPTFQTEIITDVETGVVLHNYQSTVVGKFTIDGDLFIMTGTGDIIKVEFNLI